MGDLVRTEEAKPRRPWLVRMAILVTGWAFVALGILGLFLPILQGILFLAIGGMLLSMESPWAQRVMERLRIRYPVLDRAATGAQKRTTGMVARIRRRLG